jgi:Zn-dependent peptidase ImmA (M78 family)
MTYDPHKQIYDTAAKMIQKYGTRDPFELAKSRGIHMYICQYMHSIKGMYSVIKRRRCIFINGNLSEEEQRLVCAHELAHDALHRKLAQHYTMSEVSFFTKNRTEYEANLFTAHVFLQEGRILELAEAEYGLEQIAAEMNTYVELLLIKLEDMNRRGYQMNVPYAPTNNFWND